MRTTGTGDFLIALGYKGEYIKRYMAEYASLSTNMTVDLATGKVEAHESDGEVGGLAGRTHRHRPTHGDRWAASQAGAPYLEGETFMMTFGDGVCERRRRRRSWRSIARTGSSRR